MTAALRARDTATGDTEGQFVTGMGANDGHAIARIDAARNGFTIEPQLHAIRLTGGHNEPHSVIGGLFQHDFFAARRDIPRHRAFTVEVYRAL